MLSYCPIAIFYDLVSVDRQFETNAGDENMNHEMDLLKSILVRFYPVEFVA